METLHITLPDGMKSSIRKIASKRGISLSELVQDYFQKLISEDEEIAPEVLEMAGLLKDGANDHQKSKDKYFKEKYDFP